MGRLFFGVVALVLLSVTPTAVSTLPCSSACALLKGQPFTVVYDFAPTAENPDLPDSFTLYQNGAAVQSQPYSALASGSINFGYPTGIATAGSYTLTVAAVNSAGESVGDPIALTIVKGRPAKVTHGRLQ